MEYKAFSRNQRNRSRPRRRPRMRLFEDDDEDENEKLVITQSWYSRYYLYRTGG